MKLLKSLAICAVLSSVSLTACATPDIQTSLSIAEQGFTAAQVLYNSVCAANASASFCSAEDLDTANAAANLVRTAIETAQNVLANSGSSQAQITAAIQGVIKAEADFEKIINRLQAKKAAAMARAARH